jgi:thiamine-phosphate pyrophosphorylase
MTTPNEVYRILDANLNRAREALRVIEEYARFILDDSAAAQRVKKLRHDLRSIVAELGSERLLCARDIVNDVGRDLKTADELTRASASDVLHAAFARLTEAARVLGEYAKLISAAAAAGAERVRYESYELQQVLLLRGDLRKRFRDVRLYVLITESLCRRDWFETAAAAIRGGATCLQLREKTLAHAELLRRAERLRELTANTGTLLIINDRPDIAKLCRADGVHVGQDDLSVAAARRIVGPGMLIGKSTRTREQFAAALAENPDNLAVGPVFASPTKPEAEVAGLETLAAVARLTGLPVVAIGGITAENAAAVTRAGAGCVCVCSAVIGAEDPAGAAAGILARIQNG